MLKNVTIKRPESKNVKISDNFGNGLLVKLKDNCGNIMMLAGTKDNPDDWTETDYGYISKMFNIKCEISEHNNGLAYHYTLDTNQELNICVIMYTDKRIKILRVDTMNEVIDLLDNGEYKLSQIDDNTHDREVLEYGGLRYSHSEHNIEFRHVKQMGGKKKTGRLIINMYKD